MTVAAAGELIPSVANARATNMRVEFIRFMAFSLRMDVGADLGLDRGVDDDDGDGNGDDRFKRAAFMAAPSLRGP